MNDRKSSSLVLKPSIFLILLLGLMCKISPAAQDLSSDTWTATDSLGRTLPDAKQVGQPKPHKWVGIFYWTWHTMHGKQGPYDNTQIITADPNHPQFGPFHAPHHWGKPELGYYISTDPFVLRKHAAMLTDAGVDVVLFDTTNPPFTFKESYMALCEVFTQVQKEGNPVPQIAFICPFGDPTTVVEQVYRDLYEPGQYRSLWFQWKGKPLILADPAYLKDPKMKAFFTFRKPMPTYFDGPTGPNQWGWLEVFPQHAFYGSKPEQIEQVTVGVAQNAVHEKLGPMSHKDGAYGRSRHNGQKDPAPDAVLHGYNFQEQWDRALQLDPPFIFITGWNEWVAGRFAEWAGYTGKDTYYPDAVFVDQYSQEYSRDVEPMEGGHGDNYYYQMVANIRRFKGVRPLPTSSGPKAIAVDGQFEEWESVGPEYRDTIGDTAHRDHAGYGSLRYTNTTGRNDFVAMKAAYDAKNVYFYAQTQESITAPEGQSWMLLFIDADQNAKTGWNGYDYLLNRDVSDKGKTTVYRWDSTQWTKHAEAAYRTKDNQMEIAVERGLVGLHGNPLQFDFHWADNMQNTEDITEFAINGDSAPNRRFNYRFQSAETK
jgi:hypothetical protein